MGQKIDLTQQVQGILPEANGGAGFGASGLRFSDAETPGGVVNGGNKTFTLLNSPSPVACLLLFLNKTLQIQGTDYTLSGNTISMTVAPSGTPSFLAWYRYATLVWAQQLYDGMALSDAFLIDAPAAQLPIQMYDQFPGMADSIFSMGNFLFLPLSDSFAGMLDGFATGGQSVPINQPVSDSFSGMADFYSLVETPSNLLDILSMLDAIIVAVPLTKVLTDTESANWLDAKSLTRWLSLSDQQSPLMADFYSLVETPSNLLDILSMLDALAMVVTQGMYSSLLDSMTAPVVVDPFNATLGSYWTAQSGTMAYDGSTGLEVTSGGNAFICRGDINYPTAQYAQTQVVALYTTSFFLCPSINVQSSGVKGYLCACSNTTYYIRRFDSSASLNLLATFVGPQISVGDVIRLENDGAGNLTLKRNGAVIGTVTDTTYSGGTVGMYGTGVYTTERASNFAGGPLGAASSGQADAFLFILSPILLEFGDALVLLDGFAKILS